MLNAVYKYDPKDFTHILGLSNELELFYELHETCMGDKSFSKKVDLEKHWIDLFFTLKHRTLEGTMAQNTACEIREYLQELRFEAWH